MEQPHTQRSPEGRSPEGTRDDEAGSRAAPSARPTFSAPSATGKFVASASTLLGLQRLAGNRAATTAVRGKLAAHRSHPPAPGAMLSVQRDEPVDAGEVIVSTRSPKDVAFAHKLGAEDAAHLRKVGGLTKEDKDDINAKLKFFRDAAHDAYKDDVSPALLEVGSIPLSKGQITWMRAGRDGMTKQAIEELNLIQKLKADRIGTWKSNASVSDTHGLTAEGMLEVVISVVAEGFGGVLGWSFAHGLEDGAKKEFFYLSALEAGDLAAEKALHAALTMTQETLGKGSRNVLRDVTGNASSAIKTYGGDILGSYAEAIRLHTITEEGAQSTEFNQHQAQINDADLASVVLGLQATRLALDSTPEAFMRELSAGLLRFEDEMYTNKEAGKKGESADQLRHGDNEMAATEERAGNITLLPKGLANIGGYLVPNLSQITAFEGSAKGANKATLSELNGTPVKDLPMTLGFRLVAKNPFEGALENRDCWVAFTRFPDGTVRSKLGETVVHAGSADTTDNGLEWLASYALQTVRELTDDEIAKNASAGAQKLYDQIKNVPVTDMKEWGPSTIY